MCGRFPDTGMGRLGFAVVDNGCAEPPFGETIFRAIKQSGRIAANRFSPKVIWVVVKDACSKCAMPGVAPHDLRRTCARLCHEAGGELEQIQFLLGHVSVETTERYLGCKQRFRNAVNDRIGIEPE